MKVIIVKKIVDGQRLNNKLEIEDLMELVNLEFFHFRGIICYQKALLISEHPLTFHIGGFMKDSLGKQFVYLICPCCQAELPFSVDSEVAKKHLIECAIQAQLEAHPEVGEYDPQDGCENLASRPLKDEEMGKPSNR